MLKTKTKTNDAVYKGRKLKYSKCGLCQSGKPIVKPLFYFGNPYVFCAQCGVEYMCAKCGKDGGTYSAVEYDSYCKKCLKNNLKN